MIEIVSERGYEATTVRALAKAAGVSTRTFYQHYSDKEACFLRTHQILLHRALGWLRESDLGVQGWEDRVSLGVDAITQGWARDSRSAHVALIDSCSVGPKALAQWRQASRFMRRNMMDARTNALGKEVPSVVTDGIVAGLHEVLRSQLRTKQILTSDLNLELKQWALSYCDPAVRQLGQFNQVNRDRDLKCVPREADDRAFTGDIKLLLSAAAKVAVDDEHGKLTPRRIFAAAGVPRRVFYRHFANADDCLTAALELYLDDAIAQARRAGENGLTPAGSVYLAVLSLCDRVSRDHIFARLCFDENVAAGVAKVRCSRPWSDRLSRLFEGALSANKLIVQAPAGACWGVLQSAVTSRRARNTTELASVLSYFILAPNIGAPAAVEAICRGHIVAKEPCADAV